MATRYLQCNNAITREEDGEVLLFEHGEEGNAKISLLNKTAYAIWNLCDGNNSVDDIVAVFSQKFTDIDVKKIETDILGFIERMVARGWLEVAAAD